MRTLYLDCGMGAAGDMLTAALLELLPEPDAFVRRLNALGIPGVRFAPERAVRCGITGTHMSVAVNGAEEDAHDHGHPHDHAAGTALSRPSDEHAHAHEHAHDHPHGSLHGIEHLVRDHLDLPEAVKHDVLCVYSLLAEAESRVHGVPVEQIHFHEVGTMDALADVTAVCLLLRELAPDEIVASPVHVGSGQVRCAHGILPVPAPATAQLLKGVPIYGGEIAGELCTPTGAALLRHFVTRFGDLPVLRAEAIGCGMGKKDFPRANCVRAILGRTEDRQETVSELSCNVDDMTAEALAFAAERLFEGGALEVYTIPVGMKKSRPGTLLRVLCRAEDRERLLALLFRHTTTSGVRETVTRRYVLDRRVQTLQTPYGEVRKKISVGWGVRREKYEYEDLARIARERGIGLDEVRALLEDPR